MDLSDVISGLHLINFCKNRIDNFDEFMENCGYETEEDKRNGEKYIQRLKGLENDINKAVNRVDLVRKIDLSVLRLNATNDAALIKMLSTARDLLVADNFDEDRTKAIVVEIRDEIAKTLKQEWEKIKKRSSTRKTYCFW